MRIRVNLLPHREARRDRQKKTFYFLTLMSFAAGLVLVGLVWSVLQGYIGGQQDRNNFITSENRKLDVQIKEVANLRQEIVAAAREVRAPITKDGNPKGDGL